MDLSKLKVKTTFSFTSQRSKAMALKHLKKVKLFLLTSKKVNVDHKLLTYKSNDKKARNNRAFLFSLYFLVMPLQSHINATPYDCFLCIDHFHTSFI
ncbi:hypothetical protein AOA57_25010 [Pseudomonas sp. 2588-5]|nr:hypothetical protein AOA57_25010 [Pseudomonas sp. 2588-5]